MGYYLQECIVSINLNCKRFMMQFILFICLCFYSQRFCFWLSKSYDRYRTKVFDFVIVYVIWDFLTWLVKFLLGSKVNRQVGFEDLIGMFYHPIAPMWYLYVLTIFYLIFLF